jgi:hypothetical protein
LPPRPNKPRSAPQPPPPASSEEDALLPAARDCAVKVKQQKSGEWTFVQPRCVRERELDLEDVEAMLDAEEVEIARDELRWLLEGCPDNIAIHYWLRDLAMREQDVKLARGHYGYAYEIGHRALRRENFPTPLPAAHEENELWFAAAKQLAWCLKLLEKKELLADVIRFVQHCDPQNTLQLAALL